jgi:hypothetical protein
MAASAGLMSAGVSPIVVLLLAGTAVMSVLAFLPVRKWAAE